MKENHVCHVDCRYFLIVMSDFYLVAGKQPTNSMRGMGISEWVAVIKYEINKFESEAGW